MIIIRENIQCPIVPWVVFQRGPLRLMRATARDYPYDLKRSTQKKRDTLLCLFSIKNVDCSRLLVLIEF